MHGVTLHGRLGRKANIPLNTQYIAACHRCCLCCAIQPCNAELKKEALLTSALSAMKDDGKILAGYAANNPQCL
jgi:hypothetical protein